MLPHTSGILGMNSRNLEYIASHNTRGSKRFADDKIYTKKFLESRGISVAKLYHVISDSQQLTDTFFKGLPEKFVIKPNRGYGGAGIIVITQKKGDYFISISGKKFTQEALRRECLDILEGKYAISGTRDDIIFEEILVAHPAYDRLTRNGLPDIRIIVFNTIPVMAMQRIPTPDSDGKANMELGAIAMGIDIATGKTNGAALKSKFLKKMPNGEPVRGFEVPFWDEILLAVSRIQKFTKIGFLGVDLVVTEQGVRVLELNARPGLKIQIANRIPLKNRLKKVADIKVVNEEEAVEMAKKLFAETVWKEEKNPEMPIIGPMENVLLNSTPPQSLTAQIRLDAEENVISSRFLKDEHLLDITLAEKRLKLPVKTGRVVGADLVLAGKFLGDFLIDPGKKFTRENLAQVSVSAAKQKKLARLDRKICEIDRQIKILAYLNPQNLESQKELFFAHPNFSPRFFYRDLRIDTAVLSGELDKIPELNHELYPLYAKKIKEIRWKLQLLNARFSEELGNVSEKIFGKITRKHYQSALKFLQYNKDFPADNSPILDMKKSREILEDFLEKNNLGHWQIKILEDSVVDIQVTKKDKILLKKGATFQENRLQALLAHEIGTHVFRYENGKLQPLEIFARGTAGYLQTEEGLAVYNQNQLGLALGEKYLTPALLIVSIYMAKRMSFQDLFHYLVETFEVSRELAWRCCVKSKRGLEDTSIHTAFTKDSIYFLGLAEIESFVKKGGNIQDIYMGKITTEDWNMVKNVEGVVKAKWVL